MLTYSSGKINETTAKVVLDLLFIGMFLSKMFIFVLFYKLVITFQISNNIYIPNIKCYKQLHTNHNWDSCSLHLFESNFMQFWGDAQCLVGKCPCPLPVKWCVDVPLCHAVCGTLSAEQLESHLRCRNTLWSPLRIHFHVIFQHLTFRCCVEFNKNLFQDPSSFAFISTAALHSDTIVWHLTFLTA